MLESFNAKTGMQYQRLSEEERTKRGILGRLVGPAADFQSGTRNGRLYTEELWDKVFDNPIVKEKLANRCIFGELGHPIDDRTEIDMEKIAVCLAEQPKKGPEGKLHAIFDILDTPNGRILKTLCDYGCNVGISSRGQGDVTEDWNGNESVDPDTYEFECFDIVLLPAVKAARLKYVTESLNGEKTLKKALCEELEAASEDAQKIMKETLEQLNIDYNPVTDEENMSVEEDLIVQDNNIDETSEEEENVMAAEDSGAETLEALQEALKRNAELENKIKELQEKLSVCYTKEARYSATLGRTKTQVSQLTTSNSELNSLNESLKEKVKTLTSELETKNSSNETLTEQMKQTTVKLQEGIKLNDTHEKQITSLNENLKKKTSQIISLQEKLSASTNAYEELKKSSTSELKSLTEDLTKAQNTSKLLQEQLDEALRDSKILKSRATAQEVQSKQLLEKYKNIAKIAVDKYINSQASRLGIKSEEIKSRLSENYSFKDIDQVCESLQQYKLNANSLPFDISHRVKAKITESAKPTITTVNPEDNRFDDSIDETLKSFM